MRLLPRLAVLSGLAGAALVAFPPSPLPAEVAAEPLLQLDIAPSVAIGPVDVRVRIRVRRHAENRGAYVVVENTRFYRSSFIQLDGEDAAKTHQWWWKSVPGDIAPTRFSVDPAPSTSGTAATAR